MDVSLYTKTIYSEGYSESYFGNLGAKHLGKVEFELAECKESECEPGVAYVKIVFRSKIEGHDLISPDSLDLKPAGCRKIVFDSGSDDSNFVIKGLRFNDCEQDQCSIVVLAHDYSGGGSLDEESEPLIPLALSRPSILELSSEDEWSFYVKLDKRFVNPDYTITLTIRFGFGHPKDESFWFYGPFQIALTRKIDFDEPLE